MKTWSRRIILAALLCVFAGQCMAQDMEPRRWSHLPIGMNVFGVGALRQDGHLF
jgi:hypothetical protein